MWELVVVVSEDCLDVDKLHNVIASFAEIL